MRISENEFLPEKDQSFKISIDGDQMSIHYLQGPPKILKQSSPKSQEQTSSYAAVSRSLNQQSVPKAETKHSDTPVASSDKNELGNKKPIKKEQERQNEPTTESTFHTSFTKK